MALKTSALKKFIDEDVWKTPLNTLPKFKAYFYRQVRIWVITISEYQKDKCSEKASALTYFSILSIVPVIALAFGIATAFNLEDFLTTELEGYFVGQQEVLDYMITFARTMLTNTSGGIISGISSLFLIFTVAKLFNNIELSFNSIWQSPGGRSFQRKVSDYMSVIFLGPIILIVSSTSTVFLTTQIENLTEQMAFLGLFKSTIIFLIQLIPYTLIWLLLFLVYIVFPNTKVKPWPALIAGILAGTIYQILQWAYINFQIGVSNYSAIYGSFAALPLFMIWLQLSWLITLFGAEYAFAVQNVDVWSYDSQTLQVSAKMKKRISLLVTTAIAKDFKNEDKATSFSELSAELKVPKWMIKLVCQDLVTAGVLIQVKSSEDEQVYIPAVDLPKLTIAFVMTKLDLMGGGEYKLEDDKGFVRAIDVSYDGFEVLLAQSPLNKQLTEL